MSQYGLQGTAVLLRKAERLRAHPDQPLRLLVSGAPGIGKTSLVNLIARALASHPAAVEEVSELEVRLDVARDGQVAENAPGKSAMVCVFLMPASPTAALGGFASPDSASKSTPEFSVSPRNPLSVLGRSPVESLRSRACHPLNSTTVVPAITSNLAMHRFPHHNLCNPWSNGLAAQLPGKLNRTGIIFAVSRRLWRRCRNDHFPTVGVFNRVGAIMLLIIGVWTTGRATADLAYTFSSATGIAVESDGYSASGRLDLALGYSPQPGTNLTVVKNTGPAFIAGNFDSGVHGAEVALTYNGIPYRFIANYYGGNGRSLVLQWATPGLAVWGANGSGAHGNNNNIAAIAAPETVFTDGAMAGLTVVAVATGEYHCLAMTANGRMFGWGRDSEGQLARTPFYDAAVPVAMDGGALAGKTVVAIAAGETHSLALTSEGRVFACGSNYYGQLGEGSTSSHTAMTPVEISGALAGGRVTAIATCNYHNLALRDDGRVFAWGNNSTGQLGCGNLTDSAVPVAVDASGVLAGKVVVGIAAGIGSSMALTADGKIYSWGANQYGQLGNGTTAASSVPVAVTASGALAGMTVTSIAAGGWHGMALSADGRVFTWGYNAAGQLGNNSTANSPVPVSITISGSVRSIAAGTNHSLAATTTGGLRGWGSNGYGQAGSPTQSYQTTPTVISFSGTLTGRKAIAVAAGHDHSFALIDSGAPMITAHPTGKLAAAGATATFAVSVRNALPFTVRWQLSPSGTAGPFADIADNPTAATTSLALSGVAATQSGSAYRAVLTNASGTSTSRPAVLRIVTWVADFGGAADLPFQGEGMVATGSLDVRLQFAPEAGTNLTVMKNTGPAFISGTFDNLAQGAEVPLTFNGVTYRFIANYYGGNGRSLVLQWPCVQLAAWGGNMYGQVGDNSTSDKSAPVAIGGLLDGRTVIAVSGGSTHSLALTADGRVFAWGNNANGQLGTGTKAASRVPTPVVTDGTLAGRCVVAIAAGIYHSLALTSDGRLFGWGGNYNGELGDNVSEDRLTPFEITASGPLAGRVITGMAVGINHCLAFTAEGWIYAWGSNSWRQLGNDYIGQGTSGPVEVLLGGALAGKTVVDIAAGETRSLALTTAGEIVSWGDNLGTAAMVSGTGALAGKTVMAIEEHSRHFLALASDGRAYSWGSNFRGQLGNGTTLDSSLPVAVNADGVLAGKTIAALSAGSYHSLALTTDGGCYGWGVYTGSGNTGSTLPQQITGVLAGRRMTAFSAGIQHSLAVYGTGPPVVTLDPANQLAAAGASVRFSAEARDFYPTAIRWQESAVGGDGPFTDIVGNPTATAGTLVLADVNALNGRAYRAVFTNSAGFSITSAARLTLTDWVAAFNSDGDVPFASDGVVASGNLSLQLNHAPTPGADLTAISNTGTAFISGGFDNVTQGGVIRLSHGGVTYAFIANYYGGNGRSLVLQWPWRKLAAWGGGGLLGNGTSSGSNVPAEVRSSGTLMATTVVGVSAGESHSLAVTAAGRVYGWGGNSSGQLGNGGTSGALEPVAVDTGGALAGHAVVAAVAGSVHSLTLTSDGRAYAWGSGSSGQLGNGGTATGLVPVPVDVSGALAGKVLIGIAAGNSHSLALTSEGRVVAWGSNSWGQLGAGTANSSVPVAVDPSGVLARKRVVAIAAGYNHSLALTSDGRVYSWGLNGGKLGNGSTTDSNIPVAVDTGGVLDGKTVVAIAAAQYHSLALTSDGQVVAWGGNSGGHLGDNGTTDKLVPVAVDTSGVLAGKIVRAISAGWEHTLAVTSEGLAYGWGHNWQGALGDGTTTNRLAPVAVSTAGLLASRPISTLAGGSNHSLAVFPTEGGPVVTREPNGLTLVQGVATEETVRFSAAAVDVLPFAVRWQMSQTGSAGLFEDITNNPTANSATLVIGQVTPASNGQAFRAVFTNEGGSRATRSATLRVLTAPGPIVFASAADCPFAGDRVSVSGALDLRLDFAPVPGTDLTIVRNAGPGFISGIFDNLPQGSVVPLTFNGLTHNYIINYYGENGRSLVLQWPLTGLAAWGGNSYGQVGDNSTSTRYSPVTVNLSVLAGKAVVAVACGGEHSLALTAEGRVFAWGNNAAGQLGAGAAPTSPVPIAVDVSGVLAGKRVVAVAAGAAFSLALTDYGEVFAWGANNYGQLGNSGTANSPQPVAVTVTGEMAGKSIAAIACGGNHAVALTTDGTLFSWGDNSQGQLGVGASSAVPARSPVAVKMTGVLSGRTAVSVAGGGMHSLALALDGTICSWGRNDYGQLGTGVTGNQAEPVAVYASGGLSGKVVKTIAAGDRHSLALTADGRAFAWGMGFNGQLGVGYQVSSGLFTPTAVSSSGALTGKLISFLAAGANFSLATTTDGKAYAWGSGVYGQLGYGSANDKTAPEPVSSTGTLAGQNVLRIAGGKQHSLSLFGLGYAPVVTADPEACRVASAAVASFSAAATGYPAATVRWQLSKTGPTGTFTNIGGNASATTTTLILTNVSTAQNGYAYRAVFTNSAGSVPTSPAVLTVVPPPVITVPIVPMVPATDKNGAVVTFEVVANDLIDGLLAPLCSPPSGSVFPVGTTLVNCTVTNSLGGTSSAVFPVTVQRSFEWYRDQYGVADSDPLAAPVHLGMSYLEAYAFAIDPTAPDRSRLPTAAIVSGHLEVAWVRWSGTADLDYGVELSEDLVAWRSGADVTEYVSVELLAPGLERVTVRDLAPIASSSCRYIRIRIGH